MLVFFYIFERKIEVRVVRRRRRKKRRRRRRRKKKERRLILIPVGNLYKEGT